MSQSKVSKAGVRGGRYVLIACEWCGAERLVPFESRTRRFCAKPATCCYDYLKRPKELMAPAPAKALSIGKELLRRQRSAASRKGQAVSQARRDKTSATLRGRHARGEIARVDYDKAWTPEKRAQQSGRTLQLFKDGRLDPTGYYKGKHTLFVSAGRVVKMRSRSEALFAHHLDSLGVDWEYEPQRFDLGWATYTPDFYLPEFDHWVEIKGWWTEVSRRKFDEFATQHSASAVMAKPLLKGHEPTIAQIMKGVE